MMIRIKPAYAPPAEIIATVNLNTRAGTIELEHPCNNCMTQGRAAAPAWRERSALWNEGRVWERPQEEIDAWVVEHPEPNTPEIDSCGECDGTGWLLTANGTALLAFLRRHQ